MIEPLALRTPSRANWPGRKRKPESRVQRRLNSVGDHGCTLSNRWRVNFSAVPVILRPSHSSLQCRAKRRAETPLVHMPIFTTPFAQLDLLCQPEQQDEPLQAFDAADEYLLNPLHEQGLHADSRVLLLNDSFGALAASLAPHCVVTSGGDSHLGYLALQKNLARNQLPDTAVTFVPASQVPQGPFDWVLIRVPKTLALLEEQLIRLHGQLAPGARVIAGAMLKHLPRAAGDLLERYIGPVQASLAVKKARLLSATPTDKPAAVSPYPSRYALEQPPLQLLNHANLFCREGLDIGTRAFLPHLPKGLAARRVAALGGGNGVLGTPHALANPQDELTLVD